MSEINFLTQRQHTLTKLDKKDLIYRKYALIGFSVVCGLFFLVAGVNIFLTSRLRSANNQQQALTQQISNEEPVEIGFLVFSQKLKTVQEIYESRSNKQQAIDFFSNIFGSQVLLSGMNYEEGENALSLRLTSENIFAFENTLSILDSPEVSEVFSSVSKSALRRDETGNYSLDIAVELKTEGEKN